LLSLLTSQMRRRDFRSGKKTYSIPPGRAGRG
jgi:hypothetical protein